MKKTVVLLIVVTLLTAFAPHKQLTWMAIGDSITYHNGHPEATKNRITKGYMDDVIAKLPYIRFANHGHGGWTSKNIADNIEKLGLVKADFYSIFFGTNDWWNALPIGTISNYENNTGNQTLYGAYRTIVNKIKSLNPKAVIILITPMHRTDFVDVNDSSTVIYGDYKARNAIFLSQYADAIKEIATTEKFELADLYYKSGITLQNAVKFRRLKNPETGQYQNYTYPDYVGIPYNPQTDDYPYPVDAMDMTYDGLHPSDKGHATIAKMLIKIMRKY